MKEVDCTRRHGPATRQDDDGCRDRGSVAEDHRQCRAENKCDLKGGNMFRIAGLFALLMLSSLAVSAQSSIDDCEKIQQADAYNKCLAQFGPMRGQRAARPAGKKYD